MGRSGLATAQEDLQQQQPTANVGGHHEILLYVFVPVPAQLSRKFGMRQHVMFA